MMSEVKIRKFRLKGGKFHIPGKARDENGLVVTKVVFPGDVVETTSDLAKAFPNRFDEITPGLEKKVNVVSMSEVAGELDIDETAPPEEPKNTLPNIEIGEEVTDDEDFEVAKNANLRVFKDGKEYWVFTNDGVDPLNKEPLKRLKVEAFISDHLAEQSESEKPKKKKKD